VCDVTLSSKIGNKYGHVVGTVEHLMAALAGLRIDNAIIEINGPEVPIMDGSAQPFVELIEQAGICELAVSRRVLRIKKTVRVENNDSFCELLPDDESVFEAEIDFETSAIGRQSYEMKLDNGRFDDDVASARTFCMLTQVEAMHSAGLALGGSVKNAIVIDGDEVMNEEGLRSPSEFVQHKLLDAIGDLYLLGLHVVGRYRGYKSGHSLHNKLLNALFMEPEAFEIVNLANDETILAAE
jgi:UDP-3-O-[3-hydroxymyristoyl] N-acetylglucosamine deacetylase